MLFLGPVECFPVFFFRYHPFFILVLSSYVASSTFGIGTSNTCKKKKKKKPLSSSFWVAVCKCASWCGDQAVAVEDGCVGVVVWYAYKGLGYLDLFYSSHKSSLPLPPL